MSSWKDRATFLTPNPVEHTVNGQKVNFYPVSIGLAFKVRNLAKPIAAAMSVLFSSDKNDSSSVQREIPVGDGTISREIEVNAISPELAAARHEISSKALTDVVGVLMDETNLETIAMIVMDSMQEIFPRGSKDNPPPKEFLSEAQLPLLPEMLVGVAKANKGVFGPLADLLGQAMGRAEEVVRAKVSSPVGSPSPQPPSSSETPG